MTLLIDVLRVTAWFGVVVFMASYHLLAPWWRSEIGRNLMTWSAGALLLLSMGVLQQVFGAGAWVDVLRLAGFAVFAGAGWWRWSLLIRAQRDGRAQEHLPPPTA